MIRDPARVTELPAPLPPKCGLQNSTDSYATLILQELAYTLHQGAAFSMQTRYVYL